MENDYLFQMNNKSLATQVTKALFIFLNQYNAFEEDNLNSYN